MEKFEYNGYEYNIVESFEATDVEGHNEYEVKKTSKSLIKTIFPILPIWQNGKFRWFKKCKVRYRLYFSRKEQFDDGWSYQHYWGKWKKEFRLETIIN